MYRQYLVRFEGLVEQCGTHCTVDPSADQDEHLVVTDRLLYVLDAVCFATLHRVVACQTGDVKQKVLEHCAPVLREVHFRMELDAIKAQLLVVDTGTRRAAVRYGTEIFGYLVDRVTVS